MLNKDQDKGEHPTKRFPYNDLKLLEHIIGLSNVKRWNSLKSALMCKTNEAFAKELLDIADEHIKRFNSKEVCKKCLKMQPKSHTPKHLTKKRTKRRKSLSLSSSEKENCQDDVTLNNTSNSISNEETLLFSSSRIENASSEDSSLQIKNVDNVTILEDCEIQSANQSSQLIKNNDANQLDNSSGTNSETLPQTNLENTPIPVCQTCDTIHNEDYYCPINYPKVNICDKIQLKDWSEHSSIVDYCEASLPNVLKFESDPKNTSSIFTLVDLEPFTQFGPLVATSIKEIDIPDDCSMEMIRIIWQENEVPSYLSCEKRENCNWMKYLKPAPTRDEKNVLLVSKHSSLYAITTKHLEKFTELLYWQDSPNVSHKKNMEKKNCGGCNITFKHVLYFRMHCTVFHDVRYSLSIRRYHCKICEESILGRDNMIKHASELHNGDGAYQCQFCQKFFLRFNYLELHRTYGCAQNPQRSRLLCDLCGKKFCQPQKLRTHIKRMHSDMENGLKDFQCTNCSKLLSSKTALHRHLKDVHNTVTFTGGVYCQKCGKCFKTNSNLKIHMLTHSGIKPFGCTIRQCSAAFTTKQCLQQHYKRTHKLTGEEMPKIERSIDYTFEAYSGNRDENSNSTTICETNRQNVENANLINLTNHTEYHNNSGNSTSDDSHAKITGENSSLDIKSVNSMGSNLNFPKCTSPTIDIVHSPVSQPSSGSSSNSRSTLKILSKGSKKWLGDNQPPVILMQSNSDYKQDATNASLLVEAALDSVCSEPNIDIDVESTTDALVNNLYNLSTGTFPEVNYTNDEYMTSNDKRDMNLMSPPSVDDQISVTGDINDDDLQATDIDISYPQMYQNVHDDQRKTDEFYDPHNEDDDDDDFPTSKSPTRSAGSATIDGLLSPTDSDDVHNLSMNPTNQLNLSLENKANDKETSNGDAAVHREIENRSQLNDKDSLFDYYSRKRFLLQEDNDFRFRTSFESTVSEKFAGYNNDSVLVEPPTLNNEQYHTEHLNFQPTVLLNNSTPELQGLDMSTRGFQNYSNLNHRYHHHLYSDMDPVNLRLNYSPVPPPPTYSHSDMLRVISLDLSHQQGRHSVDLSIRPSIHHHQIHHHHSLHPARHYLLNESCNMLNEENRMFPSNQSRILSNDHLLMNTDEAAPTYLDQSHLLDQNRLLGVGDGRILPPPPPPPPPPSSGGNNVSPPIVGGFTMGQTTYHPTPVAPRPHQIGSPTLSSYQHYASYY